MPRKSPPDRTLLPLDPVLSHQSQPRYNERNVMRKNYVVIVLEKPRRRPRRRRVTGGVCICAPPGSARSRKRRNIAHRTQVEADWRDLAAVLRDWTRSLRN